MNDYPPPGQIVSITIYHLLMWTCVLKSLIGFSELAELIGFCGQDKTGYTEDYSHFSVPYA